MSQEADQIKTFDDIEPYTFVRYKGRPGFVTEKGHILSTQGRHLRIEFEDSGVTDYTLHENNVNRYLREKYRLFVDFTHGIVPKEEITDAR